MTVSSNNNKNTYAGDGATVVFPYTFRILDESHVAVSVKDADGTITTKTITTDYTVSGVGDAGGGNITMVTAPASGETLILLRDMPFQQNTDYIENDAFPAESHEEALDELTMNDQQLLEAQERTIKLDPAVSGVSTTLPDPAASKLLGWNSGATALENKDVVSIGDLSITGTAVNGVITYTSSANIDVETNLKFDGTDLELVTGDAIFTAGNIRLADAASINDSNDNEQLVFQETASAVNHYEMTNAATGTSPLLKAVGTDTDVSFRIASQGAGDIRLESASAATVLSGTSTSAAEIRLSEDTDNGTNYMSIKAPAAVTANTTLTLPDGAGSNGNILQTNGSGTLSWASRTCELIATASASASATIEFTDLSSTYSSYFIVVSGVVPATDGSSFYLRTSSNNGSTFDNGASDYTWCFETRQQALTPATSTAGDGADTEIHLIDSVGGVGDEVINGIIDIIDPSSATRTNVEFKASYTSSSSGAQVMIRSAGSRLSTSAVDAVQLLFSAGNIASGEFRLYGFRDA